MPHEHKPSITITTSDFNEIVLFENHVLPPPQRFNLPDPDLAGVETAHPLPTTPKRPLPPAKPASFLELDPRVSFAATQTAGTPA